MIIGVSMLIIIIITVTMFTKDLCNEKYIVFIWSSSAITFIAVINLDGWPLEKLHTLIL